MPLESYLPVAVFTVIAIIFPPATYFLTRLLRKDNPTPLKLTTYECGEVPEGEAQIQFHFQYYMFAIMFVVFDVAAIFLFLWALYLRPDFLSPSANLLAHVSILLFVVILTGATLYSLKKEEVLYI